MRSTYKQGFRGLLLICMFILGSLILSGCIVQVEEPPRPVTTTVEIPLTTTVTMTEKYTETTTEVTTTTIVKSITPPFDNEVQFGVIHSSPTSMESERIAMEIALEEIHAYAQSLGSNVIFTPIFENAEESSTKAAEKFDALVTRGVKFVLGLRWSGHCKAVLEKANEQKILLISGASAALNLAIPDDWLFRMAPTATVQGVVIGKMLWDYGIRAIVSIFRGDDWGESLIETISTSYTKMGGMIPVQIRYDPEKLEFGPEAELLNEYVENAFKDYGINEVAIVSIGFPMDGVRLMSAAAGYPTLMNIPWFGSDGIARSTYLIDEQGENAVNVRYISTLLDVPESDGFDIFSDKFQAEAGELPDIYYSNAYDSIWLLAKSILESGSDDPEVVKAILPFVAEHYIGVTGWCKFNEYGDRATAKYAIWAVVRPDESADPVNLYPNPDQIGWETIGIYVPLTDRVIWYIHPPLM